MRDSYYVPALLERRKRSERALLAVVQEASVHGISTRRVDGLVQALGITGISKSQVSRICQELDAEVERFRARRLEGPYRAESIGKLWPPADDPLRLGPSV